MTFTKKMAQAAIVSAIGLSALGAGGAVGTAQADTGFSQSCFFQFCHNNRGGHDGRGGRDFNRGWQQRGFIDGRNDHQPFNFRGHRVEPLFDRGHGGWGFWLFNSWFPL